MDHPTLRTPMDVPEVEVSFADFLDLINPLQHIPIVSSIYRAITGDEISGPAKVLGGALFGGPLGFVAGVVDAVSTQTAGGDVGEMAIAALFGGDSQDQATAVAEGAPGGIPADVPAKAAADAQAAPAQVASLNPAALPAPGPAQAAFRVVDKNPLMPPPVSQVGGQLLTGDAALQALAADVAGPGATVSTAPRPPEPALAAAAAPPGVDTRFLAPISPGQFTAQMLAGLDKYKALAAQRAQEQAAAHQLDQSL